MKKIKIVLVEDHIIVRDGIKSLLSREEDFEIIGEASNYAEMQLVFEREQPDVAILDISLPEISGIEIAKILREKYPLVKTMILSMYTSEEFILNALRAGALAYLPKNTSKKELLEAVRSVVAGEEYIGKQISGKLLRNLIVKSNQDYEEEERLTKRETEILKHAAQGLGNKEIADMLFISVRTVESHKNHIMQKLNLKSPADLIKYAIKNRITEVD